MPPRWPAFLAAPLAIAVPAAHATTYLTLAQAQQALFPGAGFTPLDLKRREHVWRASSLAAGISTNTSTSYVRAGSA